VFHSHRGFQSRSTPTDNRLLTCTPLQYARMVYCGVFQDSTNVEPQGYTPRRAVRRKFEESSPTPARLFISCFSSPSSHQAGRRTGPCHGRKVGFLGRSMNNRRRSRKTWPISRFQTDCDSSRQMKTILRRKFAFDQRTQGEPMSRCGAAGGQPQAGQIEKGDHGRALIAHHSGNEKTIYRMIAHLSGPRRT